MLFSSAGVHPSMHTSYILKQSKAPLPSPKLSLAGRKYSTRDSPQTSTPFGNNPSMELMLLSMLRGCECSCEDRVKLCAEIEDLQDEQKIGLIHFLKDIAVIPAVENNACQILQCCHSQFGQVHNDFSYVYKLLQIWDRLYKEIIPTMEDVLFTLTLVDESFCIRRLILKIFRDKVLKKCLETVESKIPELESILFTLLMETEGDDGFEAFSTLANRLMGAEEKYEIQHPASTFPANKQMRKASSAEMVKSRSKTLPNKRKSVQWNDLRKSKTVSNF
ncbi:unnamed protein product, partial [Mesorhabditis spiculigera]